MSELVTANLLSPVLNVADAEEGTMMSNLSRNIKGWAAAMTLDVMCCFRTDDMRIVL